MTANWIAVTAKIANAGRATAKATAIHAETASTTTTEKVALGWH